MKQSQAKDLATFSDQVLFSIQQYKPHNLKAEQFSNIVICGLGGSGIAGRIVKSCLYNFSSLPVEIISDYELPAYVNEKTLAIQCSYSGNTEETLSMYADARKKGATMIALATGGKLEALAQANGVPFYRAQSGYQPRMALGYSLTYLFLIMGELFGIDYKSQLTEAAQSVAHEIHFLQQAQQLEEKLLPYFPAKFVVVADQFSSSVGLRFCQQLQENTKAEAFLHELPEANHNVIESYYGRLDTIFFLLNTHSNTRTDLRFSFLKELLEKSENFVLEIDINANSLTDILQKIYVLDWLSLLLADQKEVDAADIRNINALKDFLSQR